MLYPTWMLLPVADGVVVEPAHPPPGVIDATALAGRSGDVSDSMTPCDAAGPPDIKPEGVEGTTILPEGFDGLNGVFAIYLFL